MVRSDFIFKESKLMVMPLDKDKKFKSQEWKEKNKNKENWDEVSIESVQYENFIGYGANGVVLKGKEIIPNRNCAIKCWHLLRIKACV